MRRDVSAGSLFAILVLLGCAACGNGAPASYTVQGGVHKEAAKPKASSRASQAAARALEPVTVQSADQELSAAVAEPVRADKDNVAVGVDDLTTGASAAFNGSKEFDTASIVKVDILATLLYQSQRAGQGIASEEQQLATTMIENSDNDSASDLYYDVNGSAGIDAANRVFGLRQTTAGTDGYWGLTTTTADDQIRLLRQVFTSASVLTSASRSFIQDLMSDVESDQRWGVSAAADAGTGYMVKNGWLPNPELWEINSIGEVVHDKQRMLIAVLSSGNVSEEAGISLVESIAAKAAAAIALAAAPSPARAGLSRTQPVPVQLPATGAPLGDVRALGAERRVLAVTGVDPCAVRQLTEDPLLQVVHERVEPGRVLLRVARAARE
jgi:hypothetical protein